MDESQRKMIQETAELYFPESTVQEAMKEISFWAKEKHRVFYQVTQDADMPLLVAGILREHALLNFAIREDNTMMSTLPYSQIPFIDFYFGSERSVLRVYPPQLARPRPYLEYTAFDKESQRDLQYFVRALISQISRA